MKRTFYGRQIWAIWDRSNLWANSTLGKSLLLAVTALCYTMAYLGHSELPSNDLTAPSGWWRWSDQSLYLKCAASLSTFSLPPSAYCYPIGYSVLGAIFYRWLPVHPFFVPDLFLTLGTVCFFYKIAKRFVRPVEVVLLLVLLVACYGSTVANCLVVPWNTIATQCATYAVIALLLPAPPTRVAIILVAASIAFVYLTRTADAACLLLFMACALLQLPRWKERILSGMIVASILSLAVGAILLLNQHVFNSWHTPYEQTARTFGFGGYSMIRKIYWLTLDGNSIFREKQTAMFYHFPWLPLALPATFFVVQDRGWRGLGFVVTIASSYWLYFAYNGGLWPVNIYRFLLIHYLFWTIPLLALMAYWAVTRFYKSPIIWATFIAFGVGWLTVPAVILDEVPVKTTVALLDGKAQVTHSSDDQLDWLTLQTLPRTVELSAADQPLADPHDYLSLDRPDGAIILLSRRLTGLPVSIFAPSPDSYSTIRGGTLKWRFRWPPTLLLGWFGDLIWRPTVTAEDKSARLDVTGPEGHPDGEPDEVINVVLRQVLCRRIATWEVSTEFRQRRWSTNRPGLWPIKVIIGPRDAHSCHLQLCFADFGDFAQAPDFWLEATDSFGETVLRTHVQK